MVATVLFVGLSINTAALTFIAAGKYRSALQSKIAAVGDHLLREDIGKPLDLNIPLALIEGVNEKLRELVSREQDIVYSMVIDPKGKILFHNDASMIGKESGGNVPKNTVSSDRLMITQNGALYDILFPIRDKHGKPAGTLCLGIKTDSVNTEVFRLVLWAVGVSSIVILFGSLAGWRL